jgi:F0F1-type ATP synthase delta subunit
MKEVLEEINKEIITKEDLIFFLEEINLLEGLIFKNVKVPLYERTKGKLSEEFRNFLQKLGKKKMIPQSPNQQFSFFEKLKKYFQKMPQIKLEIAFQPSREFLLKIKRRLKEMTGQETILDFVLNPEITGGLIIEYQGRRLDFSLAKEITSHRFRRTS